MVASDSKGNLDRLGVDEQGAAGQRNAADSQGGGGEEAQQAGKILHVVPCCHLVLLVSTHAPAVTTSMLLYM